MPSTLYRVLACDKHIRCFFVDSTDIVSYSQSIHQNSPFATSVLGRMLSAGLLLGATLKSPSDKLTLQLTTNGDIKQVVVTADYAPTVRGYVSNPLANSLTKDGFFSEDCGSLTVIKDMGLKEPYSSSIPLTSNDLGEELSLYFQQSDQTESIVDLKVSMTPAGEVSYSTGLFVQALPFCPSSLENIIFERVREYSKGNGVEDFSDFKSVLDYLFAGYDYQITEKKECKWHCNCSFKRGKEVLATLGKEELLAAVKTGKNVYVTCSFCAKEYTYTPLDLLEIIKRK